MHLVFRRRTPENTQRPFQVWQEHIPNKSVESCLYICYWKRYLTVTSFSVRKTIYYCVSPFSLVILYFSVRQTIYYCCFPFLFRTRTVGKTYFNVKGLMIPFSKRSFKCASSSLSKLRGVLFYWVWIFCANPCLLSPIEIRIPK